MVYFVPIFTKNSLLTSLQSAVMDKMKKEKAAIQKGRNHQHLCTRHGGTHKCECQKRKCGTKKNGTRVKLTRFDFK